MSAAEGEQVQRFGLSDLVPHLSGLVEHFATAMGVSSGVVLVPAEERKEEILSKYKGCLGNTPSPYELPPDFRKEDVQMDRITPILPECCEFCELVRQSAVGTLRCWWSDLSRCEEAFTKRRAIPYLCHMGLRDIVAPIVVGGRHVANVYAGQIRTKISETKLQRQYENLRLAEVGVTLGKFRSARSKVNELPDADIRRAGELVADLAAFISAQATAQARLFVLHDIGIEIAPSPNIRQGLLSFLRHTKRLVNADSGSVWLRDPMVPEILKPEAIDWGLEQDMEEIVRERYARGLPAGPGGGLAGMIMQDGKTRICRSRDEIDKTPAHVPEFRDLRQLGSFVGVRMVTADGAPIGVYEVGARSEGAFTDEDGTLLEALGAHAGAFAQSAEVTSTLLEISTAAGFWDLVNRVVTKLPGLVNGKGCSLFLRKTAGTGPACLVATEEIGKYLVVDDFFSNGFSADRAVLDRKAFYHPGEGLTGWVLGTGESLNLELLPGEDRQAAVKRLSPGFEARGLPALEWKAKYRDQMFAAPDRPFAKEYFGGKAWLAVPLKVKARGETKLSVLGVLRISEKRQGNFTAREHDILVACAHVIAQAIEAEAGEARLQATLLEALGALVRAIDAKDPYTQDHSRRAQRLCVATAKAMRLEETEVREIGMAALLHDIGKIGIPDLILSKPGRLNKAEKACMDLHPTLGCEILRGIPDMGAIAEAVGQHHERMDGAGYPERRRGDRICLCAKIITVVDAYDAMTSYRPYREDERKKRNHDEAMEELRNCAGAEKQFDPDVVKAFAQAFPY